jgi:hypothetical protein
MRKKGKRKKGEEKIIICRVGEIAGFILLTITEHLTSSLRYCLVFSV